MKHIEVKRVGYHLYHLAAKEGYLIESIETGRRYGEIHSCDLSRWRSVEERGQVGADSALPARKTASFLRRIFRRVMERLRFAKSKPKN